MNQEMTLKTIIVDDEPLARQRLRTMLENLGNVVVLAEFENGREALSGLNECDPDMVFLDIQMPEVNGIEFVERLSHSRPAIVFTTAFSEHAVRAFEFEAIDYLLKPFNEARLKSAIDRVSSRLHEDAHSETWKSQFMDALDRLTQKDYCRRFLIRGDEKMFFVSVESIQWIEAAGKHVRFHCLRDQHELRESMQNIEAQLDPQLFARIHRSTIVNLEFVESLEAAFNGEHVVNMKSGIQLTLSRGYRDSFRERFGM